MKIGIYTIHASHNVGAMLQAFGLVYTLKKLGADVELVNYYPKEVDEQNHHCRKSSFVHNLVRDLYILFHPKIRIMEKHFDDFHESMPLSKRFLTIDDYIKAPLTYDIHLVGSDQTWNLQRGYDFGKFYFLDYLPSTAIKMSYGASFGTTKEIKDADKASKALLSFKNISVREDSATKLVENLTGKECTQVIDPTLLLSSNEWDTIVPQEPIMKGKYIFFYGVNTDATTWSIVKEVSKRYDAKIVGYPGPLRPQYKFDEFILNGGPLQFINLIKYATAVVTSSFHGLAFSVNYNKKVFLIKYGNRMERMESLIRLLGAEACVINNVEDIDEIINYDSCNVKSNLEKARLESKKWIKNVLTQ